jgi:hypothetical protein
MIATVAIAYVCLLCTVYYLLIIITSIVYITITYTARKKESQIDNR